MCFLARCTYTYTVTYIYVNNFYQFAFAYILKQFYLVHLVL